MVLLLVLLCSTAIMYASPLKDTRLWGDLAAGQLIIEAGTHLSADPFNYTSAGADPDHLGIALKGSWLSQAILYRTWEKFDYSGLIALRVMLLMTLLALMTLASIYMYKARWIPTIIVISIAGMALTYFTGLGPDIFSYIIALALILLLENLARQRLAGSIGRYHFLLIPLLMFLWANLHTSFVLGSACIIIYIVMESAWMFTRRQPFGRYYMDFISICLLGLVATIVVPSATESYIDLLRFKLNIAGSTGSAYLSPFDLYSAGQHMPSFWYYFALSALALIVNKRNSPVRQTALYVVLAFLSMDSFRFGAFFIALTAAPTAMHLSGLKGEKEQKVTMAIASALVLLVAVTSYTSYDKTLGKACTEPVALELYPDGAVSFIKQEHPDARIFNHLDWGGYLSWHLHSEYQTFMDSRVLNREVYNHYTTMLWMRKGSEALLNNYGINTVVVPTHKTGSSEPYPLVEYLAASGDWKSAYSDDIAHVFTRMDAVSAAP